MSADQKQFAKVEVDVLNAVLKYMADKPYTEVAKLIPAIQTAEIIKPEVEKPKAKSKK
jgi:hypothetical protein